MGKDSLLADAKFALHEPFTLPGLTEHYEAISEGTKRGGVCREVLPLQSFPWLIRDRQRYYCCLACQRKKDHEAYGTE